MSRVLLVDDDDLLAELLTEYLTSEGLEVNRMPDGESGVKEILTNNYDVVPKPCQPRELLARINAILRRAQQKSDTPNTTNSISASGVTLFPSKRQALVGDRVLELTSTEFNLLEVLMRHAGQVVSKDNLSQEALDRKLAKFDRSIDVHISSIRHKLGDASLIQTVRGLGYLFVKN